MVIGGDGRGTVGWLDDIEIAAPDSTTTTVPSCLGELNRFPFGSSRWAAGGITVPGEFINS